MAAITIAIVQTFHTKANWIRGLKNKQTLLYVQVSEWTTNERKEKQKQKQK